MIALILSAICFALASVCNAVMDKSMFHYHKSIFKTKERQFWDATVSWSNKYIDGDYTKGRTMFKLFGWLLTIPVQFTDAWHLFKMLCICFLALSITFAIGSDLEMNIFKLSAAFIGYGLIWNNIFTLFFHHILKEK
tara:strand:- start:5320 stop:5730 length:411 start_codon:yes stop_codon:yes gene_type:complete